MCGLGWIILSAIKLSLDEDSAAISGVGILIGILYIVLTIGGFLAAFKNNKILYRVVSIHFLPSFLLQYSGFLVALIVWEMVIAITVMIIHLGIGFLLAVLAVIKIPGAVFGFLLANAIVS